MMNFCIRMLLLSWLTISLLACGGTGPTKPEATPPVLTALPLQPISLTDLSAFQTQDGNWSIAASASVDRSVEKAEIATSPGTGVLVNQPTEAAKSNLMSQMEHGDLELSLEFMMPKGSNSGIYFQGRYELQLLDSWGKETPGSGDLGGIYQRWDDSKPEGQKGYDGHPPRINASLAPGLWQRLSARFQAPRFDESGQKVGNARFLWVKLNGIMIHEDVELSGPTRGPLEENEVAKGPLLIQGDHGPLAFRNMAYKTFDPSMSVSLSDLKWEEYELPGKNNVEDMIPDFSTLTAVANGSTDSLSRNQIEAKRDYGLRWTGTVSVPAEGEYLFETRAQGGAQLLIGGKMVVNHDGEHDYMGMAGYGTTTLTAGDHPIEIRFRKDHRGWRQGFGVFVEGPALDRQALHATGSPMPYQKPEPYELALEESPTVLRGYVMHRGQKHTHSVSVGFPEKVHFQYDLHQGSWLTAWGGQFVDAREMWVGRGVEQIAQPMGASLSLAGVPSFANLGNPKANWPDSMAMNGALTFRGYDLDEAGAPVFRYELAGTTFTDQIQPAEGERSLERSIRLDGGSGDGSKVYVLLAAGELIEALPSGGFLVDGSYYLEGADLAQAELRNSQGQQQLIISLSDLSTLNYSLVW